jgi:adenosylhomocysteine nucleosidase
MKRLVLIALEDEAPQLKGREGVYFTGVGKVNAALAAAMLIERHSPGEVWNFGTAGGITVGPGLHECTRFVQRDMDCSPLGFAVGRTPFEDELEIAFGGNGLACGSGDQFVTNPALSVSVDIVEMEAYAIAKACLRAGVKFRCFKYVSDSADSSSATEWQQNKHRGEELFLKILEASD